jgi:hypothetical protein
MAVVRLRQRKWLERDRKWPKIGFPAGAGGSEEWPRTPGFCAVPAGDESRKKNISIGETGGASGIRTVGIDLGKRCGAAPWTTVTRGLTPRALEHACRRSWPSKPSMLARAPSTPCRAGPAAWRHTPKPELEIRLSAMSKHILSGHAVPPSSGRGRRTARRQ